MISILKNLYFRSRMPKPLTIKRYKNKHSVYDGYTGRVFWHQCKTRYMLTNGKNWLVNIKP